MEDKKLKLKQEAIKRMKMLRIMPNVIKEFDDEGVINYSERINRFYDGILFYADGNKEIKEAIDQFGSMNIGMAYHAQLTHTRFGDLLSILFVPYNESQWRRDQNDLREGYAYCYVANLDEPYFSEFGTIGITQRNGGVSRTM